MCGTQATPFKEGRPSASVVHAIKYHFVSFCFFLLINDDRSFIMTAILDTWCCFIQEGVARRLVEAALHGAARKRDMRYQDLKKIDRGVRRHFHDDITVIVLFFNHPVQTLSIRCPTRRNVAVGCSWSGT